jgi:hypothetical protein
MASTRLQRIVDSIPKVAEGLEQMLRAVKRCSGARINGCRRNTQLNARNVICKLTSLASYGGQ